MLAEPLRWRTPRKVFVNSMSDVGHARAGRSFVARTWAVMALARRHTFQVLTKRPRRLAAMLGGQAFVRQVGRRPRRSSARHGRALAGHRPAGHAGPDQRSELCGLLCEHSRVVIILPADHC